MCVKPIPIRDARTRKVHLVPCGKCIECRRAYQNEWIFRLSQEMKHCPVPLFVTLTYNDENLPLGDNGEVTQSVLQKRDVQLFLKRLRKDGTLRKFRYFAVGEYGSRFNRAHYHLVIMPNTMVPVSVANKVIENCWSLGFVKVKYCTDKQVHYVCKYMNKLDDRKHLEKPFKLYSKHLGLCFLTAKMVQHYMETFSRTCKNGTCNISLPRYFRRKLDDVVMSDPYLSQCGLDYTGMCNLIDPITPKAGSRYALFREFQERLQRLDDLSYSLFEKGFAFNLPNLREIYDRLYYSVPELAVLECDSRRKIDECKIKNGLKRSKPPFSFEPNVTFLILDES